MGKNFNLKQTIEMVDKYRKQNYQDSKVEKPPFPFVFKQGDKNEKLFSTKGIKLKKYDCKGQ